MLLHIRSYEVQNKLSALSHVGSVNTFKNVRKGRERSQCICKIYIPPGGGEMKDKGVGGL